MKKMAVSFIKFTGLLFISLLLFSIRASAQDVSKTSKSLPEDVNKIVTASCTPCHTDQGGLMSRTKLNFTEWVNYSQEKQKEKAAKMYSELNKGAMPPKGAREKRPETIPSIEQIEIIKKWSESFPAETK
ncbi:MAG: heme-binding domain-containing protein [Bacteroidales bacterium]